MLLVQVFRREIVRDDLPLLTPQRAHLFESDMITLGQQFSYITGRTIRVDGALFIQKSMNGPSITENNDTGRAKLE